MSPRNLKISPRVDGRLAAYATLAGAALAAPAIPNADADIISSGPVNIVIPLTTAGVYINVVTGVNNPVPGNVPGWDLNPFSASGLSWFAATPTATSGYVQNFTGGASATLVDNLAIGSPIGGTFGYTWATNTGSETTGITAFNLNSNNNYVGFRFVDAGVNGGAVCYGWAQVHIGASLTDPSRAIIAYAYDNTGATIPAGVPEPSTMALLGVMAAGALGVRAWRKRKA